MYFRKQFRQGISPLEQLDTAPAAFSHDFTIAQGTRRADLDSQPGARRYRPNLIKASHQSQVMTRDRASMDLMSSVDILTERGRNEEGASRELQPIGSKTSFEVCRNICGTSYMSPIFTSSLYEDPATILDNPLGNEEKSRFMQA